MTQLKTQKGFTLVELAIVMTIIGLLIGGILKGQELMENARVTSTIAQVKSYEAATTTFRDSYSAIPGDMANAQTRIPGCTAACNPLAGTPGAGDSIVGAPAWGAGDFAAQAPAVVAAAPAAIGAETVLYWTHLLLADLISGVSNAGIVAASANAWGETHPAAKIGGGFIVGYADATPLPGSGAAPNTGPSGMVLALTGSPTTGTTAQMTAAGQQPLNPAKAGQIDRKMDDGRTTGGFVQAYGNATAGTGCFAAAAGTYNESATTKQCGLFFRIQG